LHRYTSPNPIAGVDDAWTKSLQGGVFPIQLSLRMKLLPDGSQAMVEEPGFQLQESNIFVECQSQGLDSNHGAILATYSSVKATECALKCNKFFFKAPGDDNCLCTATGRLPTTRVILNASSVVARLAYSLSCGGSDQNWGYYDLATASQSPGRRLLQAPTSKGKASSFLQQGIQRLTALRPTPRPISDITLTTALRPGLTASLLDSALRPPIRLPGLFPPKQPPVANDLCFDQPTTDKESAPASCSEGSPKFVLPKAWLDMNHLSADEADPCARYKKPEGIHGVQCVNI
jgi:hypothetical protein